MKSGTVSVALCTFDGERFVEAQLRSIAAQSRVPDEIVVCDDGSNDATVEVVGRFAEDSSIPVVLRTNETRLGPARNFGRAISLASGDVIALSDQDDAWVPSKLSRLEAVLDSNPEAGLVFSDADLVDAHLRPTGRTLWQSIGFTRREQDRVIGGLAFEALMRQNFVGGLTLAFRSRYRDEVLPVPDGALHDLWIASVIAALAPVAFVPETLVLYRQHERNHVGLPLDGWRNQVADRRARHRSYGDELVHHEFLRDRLTKLDPNRVPARHLRALSRKIAHHQVRSSLQDSRISRVVPVSRELVTGHYNHYSRGLRSAGFDLVFRR